MKIYTAPHDRSTDTRHHDWWLGIYTNENRRDGLVGYVPLDSTPEQIRAQATAWLTEERSIVREAHRLEQAGMFGNPAVTIINSINTDRRRSR